MLYSSLCVVKPAMGHHTKSAEKQPDSTIKVNKSHHQRLHQVKLYK
jgi:hypothetical protein